MPLPDKTEGFSGWQQKQLGKIKYCISGYTMCCGSGLVLRRIRIQHFRSRRIRIQGFDNKKFGNLQIKTNSIIYHL